MRKYIFTFLFVTSIFADDTNSRGVVKDYTKLKFKVATAVRTEKPPVIDGEINEEIWSKALLVDEFLQNEPYNLEPPTIETEVRVLYDDKYLYLAYNNIDPNPDKIMARRSRRDDWMAGFESNSDWVGFGIDSRNDAQQDLLIEFLSGQIEAMMDDMESMMSNSVNIKRAQHDIERLLNDVEKLKDKIRENGNGGN